MRSGPSGREVLGLLVLTSAERLARRRPQRFWPVMTLGLILAGISAANRARSAKWHGGWRWLAAAVGLGAGLHLGVRAGAEMAGRISPLAGSLEWVQEAVGSAPTSTRLVLSVPAVLGEEVFWRSGGWIAGAGTVWGSALGYTAAQLPTQNPLLVMGALPLGLVTTWIRRRSGALLPAVICHLVFSEMTLAWPGLPLPSGSPRATEP
ncbi:MAG: CPBP family intramembrane glutamic endopeptidase [Candidatus Dormibacteria bacterium]